MPSASLILTAAIRLALLLTAAAVVTFCLTVLAMAMALLRPPRMTDGKAMFFLRRLSPQDLGLPCETIHFFVKDHRTRRPIRLAGWWIAHPEPCDRTALILHGYSDAKVGSIAWAPLLRSLGYHVLVIDLRAHGESDGPYSTAGFYERYDVAQVIDQFKESHPRQTRRLILFGVSLGAAVAAATAVRRDDLSAVILECPFLDFPTAVLSHADALGVPGQIFQRAALWLCQRIARIRYNEVRPVDSIAKIKAPLWVVQSECDPFVPPPNLAKIAAAVNARPAQYGPTHLWQVTGCHHVIAMSEHPGEYQRRLTQFLADALEEPSFKIEDSRR